MGAVKEFYASLIEKGMRADEHPKRDYPILFETEMVRAILSGKKTQTRRIFKKPLSKFTEKAGDIFFVNGDWIASFKHKPLVLYPIIHPNKRATNCYSTGCIFDFRD